MSSDQIGEIVEEDPVANPDFIIGVPSLNEGDTIANVANTMAGGISEEYPNRTANIINVDNASTDDTKEQFLQSDTGKHGKKYISTPEGTKGKGRNFYNLFHEVKETQPDAVACVDADLMSVELDWARKMLGSVLEGYHLVTPIYKRHQYDGTITNHICYPTTYGVNGKNVRQPIGGDFAFSPEAAEVWLNMDWQETTFQFGIDIFMTTGVLYADLPICGVHLGQKEHAPSGPNLKSMFQEVAGTLFSLLESNQSYWKNVDSVEEIDNFGDNEGYETPSLDVDRDQIYRESKDLFQQEKKKIQQFLPDELFETVESMIEGGTLDLDPDQWSHVLYSAMAAYINEPDQDIVKAVLPLYMFRNVSFQKRTEGWSPEKCEERVQSQARTFFENRSYLLDRT